jgi:RNA polymerase sigma factor (sigma-70 family)
MTDLAESLDASTPTFSIPPATDRELITLWVERQDAKSLETIIRRHGRLVHSLTHKLLTSPHDRADAFQTVFLMLSQQAQKIRQRESLAMWIYGVTVRTCLMMSRQRAHAPIPVHVEAPPYPDREVLEHQELILTLNKELHLLPEHLRESLVLVYLEGHSRQTAAELMNTTEQTIKSRLARGRNLLRARLLKQGVTFTTAFTTFSLMTPSSEAAVVLPEQLIDQTLTTCQTGELSGAPFTLPLDPITILPTGAPVMSSTTFYGTLAVTTLLLLTTMGIGNRGQAEGRVAAVNVETAVDDEVVSEENVTSIVKMTPATPVIQNTHAPHDVPVERSVPSETQSEEELSKSDNSLSPSNPGNSVSMQPAVEDETQQLPDQYSFQLYLDLKLERAKLNVAITEKQLKSQEELYRRGITSSDVEQAKLNRLDARIEYMEVLKEREVLKEVSFVPAQAESSSNENNVSQVTASGDSVIDLLQSYEDQAEEYIKNRSVLLQLQISKDQPRFVTQIEDAISLSLNLLEHNLKSIEEKLRVDSDVAADRLTQIRNRAYDSFIDLLTRTVDYQAKQLNETPSGDPRDQQVLDHYRQTLKYITYEKSLGSFDAVSQHIRTDLSAILFKEKPNEKLRKKLRELREDFGPDHPEVKRVEEQLRLRQQYEELNGSKSEAPAERNGLDKSKVKIMQSLEEEKTGKTRDNEVHPN